MFNKNACQSKAVLPQLVLSNKTKIAFQLTTATCLIPANWIHSYKSFVFPSNVPLVIQHKLPVCTNFHCETTAPLPSISFQTLLFPSPFFQAIFSQAPFPNPFSPLLRPLSPQGLAEPPIASPPTQRPPDCTRTMELI